jgi:2-polyprenyl-3-methyl-5-hydroxy-6-metoxy-1,4-benzoquinol methylase
MGVVCLGSKKSQQDIHNRRIILKSHKRLREWYRRVYGFNTYNRRQWVARQASRIPTGSKVIDVGAGSGQYLPFFTHCDYRAHDFGQVPETIGKYTTLDYESDIIEIPVPDNSFDVVLCTEVLEHVADPIKAIHEMARILRPGGRMLLTAPLGSFLHQEPYHFYGGYTPHWYQRFLDEASLEVENIEANQGFFSWFGQESQRFSSYLSPRRNWHLGLRQWSLLSLLWLLTLPLPYVLPLLGHKLDRLDLENMATVGYHVVATKKYEDDINLKLLRDYV